MGSLDGKTAIVTGAARGIGRGIADVLAREGCRLLITCRANLKGLDEAARELRAVAPEVLTLQVDIRRMEDIDRLAETARERFGELDILVNNAGITAKYPFLTITEAEFDNMFGINCRGTYFCAQKIARIMVEQKRGKIINISSLTTRGTFENFSAYTGTKAAINKFTEGMALELAPYNIQVNAVAAGWIPVGDELNVSNARKQRGVRHIPFGRYGTPRDIGEIVAFLAHKRSAYMTGQTVTADGGQSILLSIPTPLRDPEFFDAE